MKKRRGRGEGSVRYRKAQDIWEGTISLGFHADGRRNRRSVFGATKQEVLAEMARLRAEARAGVVPDAARVTVGQLMGRWLASRQGQDSPTTLESRAHHVAAHLAPRVGAVPLARFGRLHADGLVADLRRDGVGACMIEAAVGSLITALEYAVDLQLIPHNPAVGSRPKRPGREMCCLSVDGARALLAAAKGYPIECLLALALASGCRQGELLALTWQDIDLERGALAVRRTLVRVKAGVSVKEPKTAAGRRTVSLPGFALESLRERRAARLRAGLIASPVFSTKSGKYAARRNVTRALAGVIRRAGRGGAVIPDGFRWHDLRHTHASILLSQGCSLLAVSRRLGHSKPSITLNLYSHLLPGDDEKLSGALAATLG